MVFGDSQMRYRELQNDFRRVQNELRNRRFFDSGSQSPTLQKPCFSLGFNRFLEVRSSRNPWKNDRGTKFFFACVPDPVLGRFSGHFGVPKRCKKRSGTGLFGTPEKHWFSEAWEPTGPAERQRSAEVWDYVTGSASY